jgi:uncharacterized membrane protein YhaH (DUF805 family)
MERLSRGGYWLRWLIVFVVNLVVTFLVQAASGGSNIIVMIISLAVGIYMIVMGVRRMHDVDKSGWFILVPIYNLVLFLSDGTPGPNQFGNDPKGRGGEQGVQSAGWVCPSCGAKNTSLDKDKCFKCGVQKSS